ncbi:MAG TPA: PAS domain-containing protein, partial [Trichocoleus sp.]
GVRLLGLSVDITERKQAEIALRQSEEHLRAANERFQLAARAVNCVIYDWDLASNQIERTDGLTRLLGYSLEETEPTGQWWCDRIHPDDFQSKLQLALAALQQEDSFAVEYRILDKKNQYIDVLDQGLVVARDASSRPTRIVGSTANISDRKHAEQQLQESQRFVQQIADALPGILYVYDMLEQRNVYVNRQIAELVGYTPEQIRTLGDQLFLKLMHPEDLANLGIEIARLNQAQDGEVIDHEYRLRHANGEWRWLWSRNTVATRTQDGRAHQVVGTAHDVTDRKRVEDELRQSEKRLQLAQQAGRIGTWEWNLLTDEVAWSDGIWPLLGLEPNSIVPNADTFVRFIHPDDRDAVLAEVEAALAQGDGYYGEFRVVQQDGTLCWLLSKGQVVRTPDGQPEKLLGINVDITGRKHTEEALRRSEEQLRLAQRAAAAGLWDWNMVTNQVTWSEEYYRLYGLDASVTPSYENWISSILEPDRQQVEQAARNALEHQVNLNVEFQILHPDKGIRWLVAIGQTFYDEQQRPKRMTGIALDITHRKQAEAEREQLLARERAAREEAERANRIKDEFLAVLSHELRTPLNPILGWTKLLQTGNFDSQRTKHALDVIERNVKQQSQLIDDLLDISRILRGKLVLAESAVDLVLTLEAALETVRLAAEARNIQIKKHLNAALPPVRGDGGRLQQIVLNLLSNAIKFTPEGGSVDLWLERVGAEAQIKIRDTGKGIAPEFLPHVFELFRQEDSKTTRRFGGLGLGLAIVRQLTELHGGTVYAESAGEGAGATFTVRLPLMPAERLECPETALSARPTDGVKPLQGVRVLVVDDEADTRELLAAILKESGAAVQTAASASEALITLAQFRPAVLVSDIGMPDVNGHMLLRQIRTLPSQQNRHIPAIALTAYAGESDQQQAFASGFQQHIAKPVEPETLVRAVAALVMP